MEAFMAKLDNNRATDERAHLLANGYRTLILAEHQQR